MVPALIILKFAFDVNVVDDVEGDISNCDTVVEPGITARQQFKVNIYVPAVKDIEPQLKKLPLVRVVVAVSVEVVIVPILFPNLPKKISRLHFSHEGYSIGEYKAKRVDLTQSIVSVWVIGNNSSW